MATPCTSIDFRSLSDADFFERFASHAKYKQRSDENHDRDHKPVLAQPQPIGLLFLGDSMFERFRWDYVDTCFSQNRVSFPEFFNAGVGGDKICNIIYRLMTKGLLEDLKACGVKCVFLEMGTNDLRNDNYPLQGVHLVQYAMAIEALKRIFPEVKIVVCEINPRKRAKEGIAERSNLTLRAIVAELNAFYAESTPGHVEVDFLLADERLNDYATFLEDDGVHLNKQGYDIFAETLQNKFGSLLEASQQSTGGITETDRPA